jgi:hypothetical protein
LPTSCPKAHWWQRDDASKPWNIVFRLVLLIGEKSLAYLALVMLIGKITYTTGIVYSHSHRLRHI